MKTRVITGIIFTMIVAALLLPGYKLPMLPLLMFFIVTVAIIVEIVTVIKNKLPNASQAITVLAAPAIFIPLIPVILHGDLNWKLILNANPSSPNRLLVEREWIVKYISESTSLIFLFLIIFAVISTIYFFVSKGPKVILDAMITPLVSAYVVIPFSCAVMMLYIIPNGYLWMLSAVITAWITDVFAFFSGVTFGKHKIVPNISPKKTWEGTIGGMLGSMFIMTIWMSVFMNKPDIVVKTNIYLISFGVVMGMISSLGAQFGDWFASAIKRSVDAKDFGTVLPGHGGITDRFDGVIFTMPIMLIASLFYYLV